MPCGIPTVQALGNFAERKVSFAHEDSSFGIVFGRNTNEARLPMILRYLSSVSISSAKFWNVPSEAAFNQIMNNIPTFAQDLVVSLGRTDEWPSVREAKRNCLAAVGRNFRLRFLVPCLMMILLFGTTPKSEDSHFTRNETFCWSSGSITQTCFLRICGPKHHDWPSKLVMTHCIGVSCPSRRTFAETDAQESVSVRRAPSLQSTAGSHRNWICRCNGGTKRKGL